MQQNVVKHDDVNSCNCKSLNTDFCVHKSTTVINPIECLTVPKAMLQILGLIAQSVVI